MDRLARVLPRRLILPPLGWALIGMVWLAAHLVILSLGSAEPPERLSSAEFTQPGLLPGEDWARRLLPPSDRSPILLAGGVSDGQDAAPLPADAVKLPADAVKLPVPEAPPVPPPTAEEDVVSELRVLVESEPDEAGNEPPPVADGQSPRALGQPSGSLLLSPAQPVSRSWQLERIARQVDRQIRHGFELSGRSAHFAARAEFTGALRLIAQGLDAEHQTNSHSRSLAAGLTAIKEAEDFLPGGSHLEADLDLGTLVGGHETPVLKNTEAEILTPMAALRLYFTFAQEQLAAAADREVAGSMALHALGKLHAAMAVAGGSNVRAAESKAMAFYQAALLVFPRNYMAANDLGVLLARSGSYPEARAALEYSLAIHSQPVGWQNLAKVYGQLGQDAMALHAEQRSLAAVREAAVKSMPATVRWVDPKAFARTGDKAATAGQLHRVHPPTDGETLNPSPPPTGEPTAWRMPWEWFKRTE